MRVRASQAAAGAGTLRLPYVFMLPAETLLGDASAEIGPVRHKTSADFGHRRHIIFARLFGQRHELGRVLTAAGPAAELAWARGSVSSRGNKCARVRPPCHAVSAPLMIIKMQSFNPSLLC